MVLPSPRLRLAVLLSLASACATSSATTASPPAGAANQRVTGLGGVFFKAQDPGKLKAWYVEHLGLPHTPDGEVVFEWRGSANPDEKGRTAWATFPSGTHYFDPSHSPFMINYRVADLRALLDALRKEGVTVDEKVEDTDYGRFGRIMDPEGNRIELWEPPKK